MGKALCFAIFSLTIAAAPVHAASVDVAYSAEIGFDPTATVGVGGENAAALIDELFGPGIGASGTATLTGSFIYESATSAFHSNSRSAGYINAVTAVSASIGPSSVNANMNDIAANAATSTIGYNTNPLANAFCASTETCAAIGANFTPSGNLVQVINNSDFFIIRDGNREDFSNRDAIFLGAGFTDGETDFAPLLATPTFGDVTVHGLGLLLISNAQRSLVDSVMLPDSESFVRSSQIESTIFTLVFSGVGLNENFALSGTVTDIQVTPVPEPTTYAMFAVGTLLIGGLARRRYRAGLN